MRIGTYEIDYDREKGAVAGLAVGWLGAWTMLAGAWLNIPFFLVAGVAAAVIGLVCVMPLLLHMCKLLLSAVDIRKVQE